MNYSELTRRYFENPGHVGLLDEPGGFRGAAGSRAQGTWVQFEVRVGPPGGPPRVETVRFLAFGCPHVIAVSAWIAEQAPGHRVDARLPESVQSLRERFDAPVEKLGRLLVVEDAWIAAMRAAASDSRH